MSSLFLRDIFTRSRFLGWPFFFPTSSLKMVHCLCFWSKTQVIWVLVSLNKMCQLIWRLSRLCFHPVFGGLTPRSLWMLLLFSRSCCRVSWAFWIYKCLLLPNVAISFNDLFKHFQSHFSSPLLLGLQLHVC